MLPPISLIAPLLQRWLALPAPLRLWLVRLGPYLLLLAGRLLLDGQLSPGRLLFGLLLFWLLALPLARWAAASASLAIEFLLILASSIKEAQTGEPLLARDLLEVSQGVALSSYIAPSMYVAAFLLLAALCFGLAYRPPRSRRHWLRALLLAAPLPLLLGIQVAWNDAAAKILRSSLQTGGIRYHDYNYLLNVRENGLLTHLFQTAEVISAPRAGPHDFYVRQAEPLLDPTLPDVVMILCEGCFTTFDARFPTAMRQLEPLGFQPFYLLSPVYGGGTAEAEFEALTGLSSAVLPGIDYQGHAADFRPDARTLVRRFREAGYRTSGLHNFYANFWKRNQIYPRFGFDYTRFVEEMPWRTRSWPQDALLYDSALDAYRQSPKATRNFMFLITVRTHGAFTRSGGDYGRADYDFRLGEAMRDMTAFIGQLEKEAKQRQRPLAIAVFGDHKPSLTGAFERAGVLPSSLFRSRGPHNDDFHFVHRMTAEQWRARAETAAYVRLPDSTVTQELAQRLDGRPIFCLPAELSGLAPGSDDAFWHAVLARCRQPAASLTIPEPAGWRKVFPLPLYGERLY